MASFLSALGRARPADDIQNFLGKQKQMAVQDLQMKNVEQDLQIKQRALNKQIADEQDMLRPFAVEMFADKFEGGADGPMFKMVYDHAVKSGLVDTSQGGLGTVNKKTGQQIIDMMSDPAFASKMSRERINYWRGLYTQTAQAAAEKPGDQKIQAELQRITDGLNQSLYQDKAMADSIKAQPKADDPDLVPIYNKDGTVTYKPKQEGLTGRIDKPDDVGDGKDPLFMTKVKELMRTNPGLDETKATKLVTGALKINTNPVTGETVMVDTVTGKSTPITENGQDAETGETVAPPSPDNHTLWELSDLSTGAWSGIKSVWGKTAGQLGLPPASKTDYARQRLEAAQNDVIRAFALTSRLTGIEINRIRKEINIEPAVFDSPAALRNRMIAVRDFIEGNKDALEVMAKDTNMPKQDRADARASVFYMARFLKTLGVPSEITSPIDNDEQTKISTDDEALINKYLGE